MEPNINKNDNDFRVTLGINIIIVLFLSPFK